MTKSDERRVAVSTDAAPAAIGPYSQAIRAGGLLFCSGQIALDPKTGAPVGSNDVRAQTDRVMRNLGAVLEAGGASFGSVVKTTIFLADMNDFATVNEAYGAFFEGLTPPARATVEVSRLPKDVLVEVDAVAVTEKD
jgi:2-iminobutanoate/2-iminopropanoate deaminase